MISSNGDIRLLEAAMDGMHAVPDPADPEERKGCSGAISKLIISEDEPGKKIAMAGGETRLFPIPHPSPFNSPRIEVKPTLNSTPFHGRLSRQTCGRPTVSETYHVHTYCSLR